MAHEVVEAPFNPRTRPLTKGTAVTRQTLNQRVLGPSPSASTTSP